MNDTIAGAWIVTLGVLVAEITGVNASVIAMVTLGAVVVAELFLSSIDRKNAELNGGDSA